MVLASLAFLAAAGWPAWAVDTPTQPRVALVIGNQDYRHVERLRNTLNDARAVAAQLRERGFLVLEGYDLDRSGMNRLFNRFEAAVAEGTIAVFYYAGHGVQVGGANVLVPVDLRMEGERDLLDDGIVLAQLMDRMAAVNGRRSTGLNLLIIDACRDNPFRTSGRALGIPRGLVATGSSGIMVLYAAGSNQRALDRLGDTDTDPNGVFTRVLLREMQVPGLSIREMVSRVRMQVATTAAGIGEEQVPSIYDESLGEFIFTPVASRPVAAPTMPPPPQFAPADREALFWQSILGSSNLADYEAYLRAYPDGAFAPIARNRLAFAAPPARALPEPEEAEAGPRRAAVRLGLRELGYYAGRPGAEPFDEEAKASHAPLPGSVGRNLDRHPVPAGAGSSRHGGRALAGLAGAPRPVASGRPVHNGPGRARALCTRLDGGQPAARRPAQPIGGILLVCAGRTRRRGARLCPARHAAGAWAGRRSGPGRSRAAVAGRRGARGGGGGL